MTRRDEPKRTLRRHRTSVWLTFASSLLVASCSAPAGVRLRELGALSAVPEHPDLPSVTFLEPGIPGAILCLDFQAAAALAEREDRLRDHIKKLEILIQESR